MKTFVEPETAEKLYKCLLFAMAGFFVFEFILHFFGLPILQHHRIFLPTHDRYIAFYGLLFAGLLIMLATSHRRDQALYRFTTFMLFLGAANAVYISANRLYGKYFGAYNIDSQLAMLGIGVLLWYIALKFFESQSPIKRIKQ